MESANLLNRIVNHNILYGSFNPDLSLFTGRMGLVLFFFHYSRYTKSALYENFAEELLDDIYEDITNDMPVSLEDGLCGVSWGMLYLMQQGFVDGNADEVLEMIDRKIEVYDVRYVGGVDHYLRFRSALAHGESGSYSPSGVIQKIMACAGADELSWQNGLKIVWDETVIHSK